MAENELKVKDPQGHTLFIVVWWTKCRTWIGSHPYLGWYIAGIATLDVLLHIAELLH